MLVFALISTSLVLAGTPAAKPTEKSTPAPHPTAPALATLPFPIEGKMDGPQSPYTDFLVGLLKNWPPRGLEYEAADKNPVQIKCVETPDDKHYVGAEQTMVVNAPLARVEAVLDDIDHYKDIFPDYEDIRVISRDGNKIVTFWEQQVPLFFLPNVKYELIYLVDKSRPEKKIYRYKLKEAQKLKVSDGIIVIEAIGPNSTRFTEYDFFNADWGPLTTFSPGRIWKDSIEGLYLSDLGVKLKAENPEWSYEKIAETGRRLLRQFPVDNALKQRKRLLQ